MRSLALMLLAGTVAVACASRCAWTQESLPAAPDDLLLPAAVLGESSLFDEAPRDFEPTDEFASQPEPLNPAPFLELQQPQATSPTDSLRRQYLELQKRKADLMSDEELQAALKTTDVEILRLQAEKKLSEARHILEGIVGEYPNTEAAQAAARMLQSEEARLRPTRDVFFNDGPRFGDDRPRDDEAPEFNRSSDSLDRTSTPQDNDEPLFRRS